ncbi:cell wall-binding protein [Heyndrickxia vini]|uniref:Cell wall-binding protein n=2 Tax=Heyndrickxia vini TaxID=1476025 RepID=A0ABX7E7U0_9BACI|nr:cell wall-binding protein [Heyndrickxia vini]
MLVICVIFIPMTINAHAETSQESLHNVKQKMQQNKEAVQEKEKEKEALNTELTTLQQQWQSLQSEISTNQKELSSLKDKINETNNEIEKKKEEIVKLEDKVLVREDVIKKRLVALQENDRTNIIIDTLLSSDSIGDFLNRVSAVAVLLRADNEILEQQQKDLKQIEKDKKEIAKKEAVMKEDQHALATTQAKLENSLQDKQVSITKIQSKYAMIEKDIKQSKNENDTLQSQMNSIQNTIKKEQAAAKARAAIIVKQAKTPAQSDNYEKPEKGEEIYVTATAYSHEDTKGNVTALGYNIKKNPNMKLIAVDPSVIPLGKKVWVEGYGVAIAGDTGSAIIGHRIDVLKPSSKEAKAWGRKTVKIIILN